MTAPATASANHRPKPIPITRAPAVSQSARFISASAWRTSSCSPWASRIRPAQQDGRQAGVGERAEHEPALPDLLAEDDHGADRGVLAARELHERVHEHVAPEEQERDGGREVGDARGTVQPPGEALRGGALADAGGDEERGRRQRLRRSSTQAAFIACDWPRVRWTTTIAVSR